MALSFAKRTFIIMAALACLIVGAAGFYLYRLRQPLPSASAGAPPDILSELPMKSPVIIYVNVAALRGRQGSLLAALFDPVQNGSREDRDYQEFVRSTGFDYTRDLDRVALAIWPANFAMTPTSLNENQVVALADGRFDEPRIEAYALRSGRRDVRAAQQFYTVPGSPPVSFMFRSPSRIEITSGKGLDVATLLNDGGGSDPAMQARVDRVAGAPLFAVARADSLPASFYAGFHNSPQIERIVRSIVGLSIAGQPEGGHIRLTLDAECDSLKNAVEVSTLLDGFRLIGSVALADPKTRRQMTPQESSFLDALIREAKITHDDRYVRLVLDVTPQMLGAAPARH